MSSRRDETPGQMSRCQLLCLKTAHNHVIVAKHPPVPAWTNSAGAKIESTKIRMMLLITFASLSLLVLYQYLFCWDLSQTVSPAQKFYALNSTQRDPCT